MERKIYLVKKVSKKEGKEPFTYVQLVADVGYEKVVLTMDKTIISQVLDCSVSQLYENEVDSYVPVASLETFGV